MYVCVRLVSKSRQRTKRDSRVNQDVFLPGGNSKRTNCEGYQSLQKRRHMLRWILKRTEISCSKDVDSSGSLREEEWSKLILLIKTWGRAKMQLSPNCIPTYHKNKNLVQKYLFFDCESQIINWRKKEDKNKIPKIELHHIFTYF
jgi:hypothetical protein